MQDYEKLGAFYLGKLFDQQAGQPTDELLLYDAKDLTTHAVCVGMTGSGKTGLCVSLLEEAAIDGIPTIAIDPKGDLANLMLTFPELRPQDFVPWVDDAEAQRAGMTREAYAQDRAELWRGGLADWGQDASRIRRFRDAVDLAIYTPGSSAGLPLQVLRSLAAPPAEIIQDTEALRERVAGLVSGLLALVGIDADPVQSREHIFLVNLVGHAWRAGRDLELAALITEIQNPPFDKLGVLDIESFFPAKERFALAMAVNNLLASPAFAAWMTGEPLDINRLLFTAQGQPRISILSIAHLGDAERMFFVTVLLNEMVAWMRTQSGTGSLRAILYMDEIFGYFPPTAKPPSKPPMLTLLKQARAYGLGVVLATQNPADLDYKGLSNTGTWFIGRLQTERDKHRLLDGLDSASGATNLDRKQIESLLSQLDSRVFLMNNVHDDSAALFHTRWALSYLRGPLTRKQIQTLMADKKAERTQAEEHDGAVGAQPGKPRPRAVDPARPDAAAPPPLPPGVTQRFLSPSAPIPTGGGLHYEPALLGIAKTHYVRKTAGVDEWREVALLAMLEDDADVDPWESADELENSRPALERDGVAGCRFAELAAPAQRARSYTKWSKGLVNHLYRNRTMIILHAPALKAYSQPDESEADFRTRLRHLLRERRDERIDKLRKRYTPKLARLEERIRRARERVSREKDQVKQQGFQTAVSLGATILGALFGRKKASIGNVGRAATTLRGAGRTAKERGDVARAVENVTALKARLDALEEEFREEIEDVRTDATVDSLEFKEIVIRMRKTDVAVRTCGLVWLPYGVSADGIARPLFDV